MGTHYSHLTMADRQQIAALHAQGLSARAIGGRLGLHHATISRELSRGKRKPCGVSYDPLHGQRVRHWCRAAAGLSRRKLGRDTDSPRWDR
ncbi:MAG: helix-turn-helix domain-containing protein [Proteobacteria bacterium]|nr:helix-turn-helix domain-containing protein [Pseudomonadota bacterium]